MPTTFTEGPISVNGSSDAVQLVAKAHTTQNANIQDWRDSAGTALLSVKPNGVLRQGNAFMEINNNYGSAFGYNATDRTAPYFKVEATDLVLAAGTGGDVRLDNNVNRIVFGSGEDTNLYRSAANELATDDIMRFNAAGTFQTTVGAAGGGSALPATPTKYLKIKDEAGTTFVVPCYAAS